MSSLNYGELCRLCLVKESVSIPIFDGEGDARRLFLKIAACLPVKVSREDRLPKKICDDCLYKLENQYLFWNSTANAEKQLLQWFDADSLQDEKKIVPTSNLETEQLDLKQEILDPDQGSELAKSLSRVEAVLAEEAGRTTRNAEEEEEEESEEEGSNSEESEEDDNDNDADEPSKDDNESDENYEELEPTTFVNVSLACDEAGPSGMQQQQQPSTAPSTSTSGPAASGSPLQLYNGEDRFVSAINSVALRPIDNVPASTVDSIAFRCTDMQDNAQRSAIRNLRRKDGTNKSMEETRRPVCNIPDKVDPTMEGKTKNEKKVSKRSTKPRTKKVQQYCKEVRTIMPIQLLCPFQGCGRTYTSPYLYDSHVKTHTPKQHPCETCQKVFTKMSVLKRHMLTHSTERPYSCGVCNKRFKTVFTYDYHRKVAHTDVHKKFSCDSCSYATVSEHNLKIHKKRHNGETDFVCEVCGKGAYTRAELETHKVSHTDEKNTCEICGKSYSSKRNLFLHQEIHNPKRVKPFNCELCTKSFRYRNKLKAHMLFHSGQEKRYGCDVCGVTVNSKTYLKIHRRTHTGEKPYSCDICGKSFNAHNYLKVHKRSHTGEKPYTCQQCGKSFTQRSTLVVHMRYHTGFKPYGCQACGKSFTTRTLLTTHEKSHVACYGAC